jgi:uncharacterized protein YabN with tetrapyrrole methylase and pyrophosphatase domain
MAKIEALLEIMARLRSRGGGCPWDLEQSFETLAPYTIEEAYEVEARSLRPTPAGRSAAPREPAGSGS